MLGHFSRMVASKQLSLGLPRMRLPVLRPCAVGGALGKRGAYGQLHACADDQVGACVGHTEWGE
jgi:hypothetical protein